MEDGKVVENQAAPVEQAGQAVKTDVQNASAQAPKDALKAPTTKSETTEQPEFDYRKSYDELRKEFTKVTQDRSTLRKQHDMTISELKSLKDAQTQLSQLLAKATEKPISPEEFLKDLQTHGPQALDGYFDKKVGSMKDEYTKAYKDQANRNLALESQLEVLRRRLDAENYPDFKQLEPKMQELAESDDCPVDFSKPIAEVYDTLYKLVRSNHSEEAIKVAEQMGQQKAEAALAKESATTIAGGGKASGSTVVNPADIKDMSKLRQYFVSQLGEAE